MQISFVKSLVLDHWTDEELKRMLLSGGNNCFLSYLMDRGLQKCSTVPRGQRKYFTKPALLYKNCLNMRLAGKPEPQELDARQLTFLNEISTQYEKQIRESEFRPTSSDVRSGQKMQRTWMPDSARNSCSLCERQFTLLFRRHHCRNCGALVCSFCAPSKNTRPIPQFGYQKAVRHCKRCYRSPIIEWKDAS